MRASHGPLHAVWVNVRAMPVKRPAQPAHGVAIHVILWLELRQKYAITQITIVMEQPMRA